MKCPKCKIGELDEIRTSSTKYPDGNYVECDSCNYHADQFGEYTS